MIARRTLALALALAALPLACKQRLERVPGETDIRVVSEVALASPEGRALSLPHEALVQRLGIRSGTAIVTERWFNPYRLAEDRRRIAAFWQTYGYFDVEVGEPVVTKQASGMLRIAWTVREGPRYTISEVKVEHAPKEHEADLLAMVPFGPGEREIDLEAMRKVRHALADRLRRKGFGHATVYSRTWVDRSHKTLAWAYLVDAGPATRVGKITVKGNVRVPGDLVIRRTGFLPGDPYDLETKEKAEVDLLDTGAFASVYIKTNADTEVLIPGDAPDTGGVMRPEQVDQQGDFHPRKLDADIDLTIVVVESPRIRLRLGAGFEIDPSRADTTLGGELRILHALGPQHHLTLTGRIGYGVLFDAPGEPSGLYGEAAARYDHPGFVSRLFDVRATARYRDVLYPGFHLRELTAGPGARTAITRQLSVDVDTFFRWSQAVDFGPFDGATRRAFSLPDADVSKSAEVVAGVVWDARDDPVEPTRGALAAARADVSPAGTETWVKLGSDLRGFVPLSSSWSLAARASGSFIVWNGEGGVPLGPRLFGGGAFGMRGYGRDELSPVAPCAAPPTGPAPCTREPVGGLSLVEASLEARFLPKQKPYGAVLFGDLGGAGPELDPFADGPSIAAGIGLRLRLWYLPIALDVAYRILDHGDATDPADVPLLVFFRVGEAF